VILYVGTRNFLLACEWTQAESQVNTAKIQIREPFLLIIDVQHNTALTLLPDRHAKPKTRQRSEINRGVSTSKEMNQTIDRPPLWWWVFASVGMVTMTAITVASWTGSDRRFQRSKIGASTVDSSSFWSWFDGSICRHGLLVLAVVAWGLHVVEAVVAWFWAKENGLDPYGWALQTLVCGGPSLWRMSRKIKAMGEQGDADYRALGAQ